MLKFDTRKNSGMNPINVKLLIRQDWPFVKIRLFYGAALFQGLFAKVLSVPW